MNAQTSVVTSGFDGRMLAKTLPAVFGGWTRAGMINETACRWLNDHRLRNGHRWEPLFPEAESLGAHDIVSLASLVSNHLGAELFGKALAADLDINRLVTAYKRGRLDVANFIENFRKGDFDSRYFGPAPVAAARVVHRDKRGYTRRDKLEMSATYVLDRERVVELDGTLDTPAAGEISGWRESDVMESNGFDVVGHWPEAEVLEARGVDIVALEKVRSAIGTRELANLCAKGVSLYKLARGMRNGLDVNLLVRAIGAGLSVEVFNSAKAPSLSKILGKPLDSLSSLTAESVQ